MIPCTTDHRVTLTDPHTGAHTTAPIIAWDRDGKPLVAGASGLVRADLLDGFQRVSRYVEPHTRTITLEEGAHHD